MEPQELEAPELLTERITFRLSKDERELINRGARAYRMEAGRLVRRLVAKRLAELREDIERRLGAGR